MRIVNESRDLAIFGGDKLHPAGHVRIEQRVLELLARKSKQVGNCDSSESIINVKEARHGNGKMSGPRGSMSAEGNEAIFGRNIICPNVCLGISSRECVDVLTALGIALVNCANVCHDVFVVFGVSVDDSRLCHIKDFHFAGKIILKGGVLNRGYMIPSNVEKNSNVQMETIGAVVFERLA